jgi:hypothetical protein
MPSIAKIDELLASKGKATLTAVPFGNFGVADPAPALSGLWCDCRGLVRYRLADAQSPEAITILFEHNRLTQSIPQSCGGAETSS